ncbi:MAG: hypothetical protein AAGC56_08510 [Pseudomonadota bacterium]
MTLAEIEATARRRGRLSLAPLTDAAIREAASGDADAWLPTENELKRFKPVRERRPELAEPSRPFDGHDD